MSYATYNAANGLPPIRPNQPETFSLHTHRDKVIDNKNIIRKLKLVKNAAVRAQQMYASVNLPAVTTTVMPNTGNLELHVSGSSPGDTITISNPFITNTVETTISSSPDATATISSESGQATLTLTSGTDGVYVINVTVN